jgi:hypothetical protein
LLALCLHHCGVACLETRETRSRAQIQTPSRTLSNMWATGSTSDAAVPMSRLPLVTGRALMQTTGRHPNGPRKGAPSPENASAFLGRFNQSATLVVVGRSPGTLPRMFPAPGRSNRARASCSQDTGSSPQLPPVIGEKPLATSRSLLRTLWAIADARRGNLFSIFLGFAHLVSAPLP